MNDLYSKTGFNNHIYEMLILSVLKTKDCYSYEVYKILLDYSDDKLKITPSAIYARIYKLSNSGMLTEYEKEHGKRERLYYHMTPAGEIHLNRLLHTYWVNITLVNSVLYKFEKEYNKKARN